MKSKIILPVLIALVLVPALTFADGGFVPPDYDDHVYIPAQKAVVSWDGTTETLTLSTKFKTADMIDMAWVIPVPSKIKPEVDEADIQIFYDLTNLLEPPEKQGRDILGAAESAVGVEVIEVKTIDIYNIVILKATDSEILTDWLNENDFNVPEKTTEVFRDYTEQSDMYFIVNKINFGIKFTRLPSEEEKECSALIYDSMKDNIEYYGAEGIDWEIESQMKYNYKDECYNSSPEIVKTLVKLKSGISTPLKIEFQPKKAFYPMKASSINPGVSDISVYVLAPGTVEDKSHILEVTESAKLTKYFKEQYDLTNQNYVTLLKYEGNLEDLEADSIFESKITADGGWWESLKSFFSFKWFFG